MQIIDDYYKKPVMGKTEFVNKALEIFADSKKNYITEEYALRPDLVGMKIFDEPIFGIANPQDDLFYNCQKEDVMGSRYMLPTQWLPKTMSVISYFFPYTEQIKKANAQDMSYPSSEWLHGCIEGQLAIKDFGEDLAFMLMKEGYPSLVPANDIRFETEQDKDGNIYNNWSENHTAYIAGLGTFSMSKNIITEKGTSGRFGSILTLLEIPADQRPYNDLYEYCNRCGACATNCPVNAIDPQKNISETRNNLLCCNFINSIMEKSKNGEDVRPQKDIDTGYLPTKIRPRYGCGKCQVNVPCESKIPNK